MKYVALIVLILLSGCSGRQESTFDHSPTSSLQRDAAEGMAAMVATMGAWEDKEMFVSGILPTGSMRPALDSNALVVYETCNVADVKLGDFAVFMFGGKSYMHTVTELHGHLIQTKGFNNPRKDPVMIDDHMLVGRVVAIVYHR